MKSFSNYPFFLVIKEVNEMQSYNFNELSPWHDLLEIRVGIVFQNTTVAAISIWLTILKISQKRKEKKRKEKKRK